jgi:broad specificity phosphatase PhoE
MIAFLLAAALAPTPGCVSDKSQPGAAPALVLLVRHAEKAREPAEDPPLTPAGVQRAQDLAAALKDAGVTTIVTTQLRRTRDTAQPLADALGLSPEIVPVGEDEGAHAAAVAAAVRGHPGGIVLVVGHSNTVPKIIAALGGPSMPEICETLFANLFVLALDADAARLVRAHYGAADDPPAADCE